MNYHRAIYRFLIILKYDPYLRAKAHWELATIFETAKGFKDHGRALHHFRMVADLRQYRYKKANRRVGSFFERGTPPRRMNFTHQEFQISLDKIRIHSQRNPDNSITIFSGQHPLKMKPQTQTALVASRSSEPLDAGSARTLVSSVTRTTSAEARTPAQQAPTLVVVPEGYVLV